MPAWPSSFMLAFSSLRLWLRFVFFDDWLLARFIDTIDMVRSLFLFDDVSMNECSLITFGFRLLCGARLLSPCAIIEIRRPFRDLRFDWPRECESRSCELELLFWLGLSTRIDVIAWIFLCNLWSSWSPLYRLSSFLVRTCGLIEW